MDNFGVSAQSINSLLKKLCLNILEEHGTKLIICNNTVAKLKAKAYGVLLKHSKECYTLQKENLDLERALNVYIFSHKVYAHGKSDILKTIHELEQRLEVIRKEEYLSEDVCKNVLHLLLALSKHSHQNEMFTTYIPSLLIPGPFTLFANYESSRHYPTINWDTTNNQSEFLAELSHLKSKENPYLPKFLFQDEPNVLETVKYSAKHYNTKLESNIVPMKEQCTFTSMTRRLLGDNPLGLNVNILVSFPYNTLKENAMPQSETLLYDNDDFISNGIRRVYSWNWECLGCFGILCSKPFVCESNVTMVLKYYLLQIIPKRFKVNILSQSRFLQDLKSLCVGIQSDTFLHDDLMVFSMLPYITINGILPDIMQHFVQEFLECGTCFKRIQTLISKKDYKLLFDGFMFKALCSAMDEYLLMFRQYVFAQKDEYLISFSMRIKKLMKQLINLSYTLGVHPRAPSNVKPPMGPQFLGYIYEEIVRSTEKDYVTLLLFILKKCCHVYFKNLQKWIYYGVLDDSCNELFIGFVTHYPQNTKHFYDKAYYIRKEWVPGFLQNLEDRILKCGKYAMLLKAFKPNHPLFNSKYPGFSVCLSFEEIEKLQQECTAYYNKARTVCSHPVTIKQYLESRAEEKRLLIKKMMDKSKANLERWTVEQIELASISAEQKRKRLEELKNQLQYAQQKKINERKAKVEFVLKYLKEMEELKEHYTIENNINLRKRIEYYQEVNDILKEKEQSTNCEEKKHTQSELMVLGKTKKPLALISVEVSTDLGSCYGDEYRQISVQKNSTLDEFSENYAKSKKNFTNKYGCNDKIEQAYVTDKEGNMIKGETSYSKDTVNALHLIENDGRNIISDVLNSNASINVVQQNRLKILNGSSVMQCLIEPLQISNAIKVNVNDEENLSNESGNTFKNAILLQCHSEGQYNIPQSESSIQMESHDINRNPLTENNITLAEQQRNRNMRNDLFKEYNKEPNLLSRTNLILNLNTERACNRHKILESEFNIIECEPNIGATTKTVITETPTSTAPEILYNSITPMSTTSSDNYQRLPVGNPSLINYPVTNESNIKNGNAKTFVENEVMVKGTNIEAEFKERSLLTSIADKEQQTTFNEPIIKHKESKVTESNDTWPTLDYTQPYKRCKELLDSNFKCQSSYPYVRLNKPEMYMEHNKPLTKNLNSLSIITLTEFLQKSITIPMDVHLKLINNEIMRILLNDLHILDHFCSLRNYYFLMDGEFGAIICDGIIGRLENGASPEALFNYQVLHSILDSALGSSIRGHDKNANNLSFMVNNVPDRFDLMSPNVLNSLSLNYSIKFPLNLILTPEALEQYAKIFKYLIRVRRISWILEKACKVLRDIGKKHGNSVLASPQYRRIQLIRHKFYHFVHTLQNHITANALQASWKTFKDELLSAVSIEDIYRHHTVYINRVLFLCMLNKRGVEFYNTIENIFKITLRFYNNLISRKFKLSPSHTYFTHSLYDKILEDEMELDKFVKYTILLGNKIVRHGYQVEIGEFISLINFNQYYYM